MARTARQILVAGCLVLALARAARADKVDDLIGKLADRDNKVRLSAALNLGKMGDQRAIRPLIKALHDTDKTVRGVAAAALAKLLDATADPTEVNDALNELDIMQRTDPDAFARGQAQKAYAAVRGLGASGTSGAVGATTIYVEIGPLADTTTTPDPKMLPLARQTIERALAADFATTWPTGTSPTKQQLAATHVKAFYVDGTLTALEVTATATDTTVLCRAALLVATFPDKSVFALLDPAKTMAKVVVSGTAARVIADAKAACVEYLLTNTMTKIVVPLIKNAAGTAGGSTQIAATVATAAATTTVTLAQGETPQEASSAVAATAYTAPALRSAGSNVVTEEQIANAPEDLRALRLALEDCEADELEWWIRFPLAVDGTTYADSAELRQACSRGALPAPAAEALETALGTMQVVNGQLRVTVDSVVWQFGWRGQQWWLAAIDQI